MFSLMRRSCQKQQKQIAPTKKQQNEKLNKKPEVYIPCSNN